MNVPAPLALVFAGAAAALGLGAVTVSLMPLPRGASDAAWAWAHAAGPRGAATPSRNVDHDRAPLTMAFGCREGESVRAALPRDGASSQLAPSPYPTIGVPPEDGADDYIDMISGSPGFPTPGVSLWDQIRVSSPGDRRAFLIGSAIQVRAQAATTTRGRQSALPHGVD